jgi:hypothetical protein
LLFLKAEGRVNAISKPKKSKNKAKTRQEQGKSGAQSRQKQGAIKAEARRNEKTKQHDHIRMFSQRFSYRELFYRPLLVVCERVRGVVSGRRFRRIS